jgi:hypothetical protein
MLQRRDSLRIQEKQAGKAAKYRYSENPMLFIRVAHLEAAEDGCGRMNKQKKVDRRAINKLAKCQLRDGHDTAFVKHQIRPMHAI